MTHRAHLPRLARLVVLAALLSTTASAESPEAIAPAPAPAWPPPPTVGMAQDPNALPPPPPTTMYVPELAPIRMNTQPSARSAIYVEGNSLVFTNSIGVTYEYRPFRGMSVSAGAGMSSVTFIFVNVRAVGGQLMLHALLGGNSDSSFEVAGGVFVGGATGNVFFDTTYRNIGVLVEPTVFAGYRYQPLDGGALFRFGAGWSYGFGMGLSASIGAAF